MTAPTLDAPRALALLDEVVAADPDRVYKGHGRDLLCRYVWKGRPDCLIGHVLVRAGWTVEEVAVLDTAAPSNNGPLDAGSTHRHLPGVTADAAKILQAAQRTQDPGEPWRAAAEAAHVKARELEAVS